MVETAEEVFGPIVVVVKELGAAGLFCQCVLVLQGNVQLEQLQSGA